MATLTLFEKIEGRGRKAKKDPCVVTFPDVDTFELLTAEQKAQLWKVFNKQVAERIYSRSIAGFNSSQQLLDQAKDMASGAGVELTDEQLKNAARKMGLRYDPPKIVVFELPTQLEVSTDQIEEFLKEPEVEVSEEESEETEETPNPESPAEESADEGKGRRRRR